MSLVTRRLHSLLVEDLEEHRALERSLRRVIMWKKEVYLSARAKPRRPLSPHTDDTLINVINQITGNPFAAVYVEELIVNDLAKEWLESASYRTVEAARRDRTLTTLCLIVACLPLTRFMQSDSTGGDTAWTSTRWKNQIQLGDEDALLAALVLLIPNFREIQFNPYRNKPYLKDDMAPLLAFARLPSLRSIHGSRFSQGTELERVCVDRAFLTSLFLSRVLDVPR